MQLRPPFTSSLLPSFSRGLFRTPVHPSASFRVLVPTTSPQPKTTTPNPHSPRHTASGHPIHRHSRGRNSPPHASTIDETGGRSVPTTSHRPCQIVPLRTLLSEFPSRLPPPHDPPNPPIRTAFSTVLQLRRQPPPYFFHRPLPAQKHIIKWPYFLRHISGIPPASLTPNTPLRIIPPLMLNPIPQTTTQHKYLYIVNIHLITL